MNCANCKYNHLIFSQLILFFQLDAKRKKHCTMRQATNVANEMGAKNVIFNHFSARFVCFFLYFLSYFSITLSFLDMSDVPQFQTI